MFDACDDPIQAAFSERGDQPRRVGRGGCAWDERAVDRAAASSAHTRELLDCDAARGWSQGHYTM